jgi:Fe-S cluster biogenesis protein NfuA
MMPFTDEDLIPAASSVVEKVRPSLALDGGDIKFLTVRNGKVYVQLQGACVGCSSKNNTLKYGVERQMRLDIHPEIEVIEVPFGMENSLDSL